MVRACPGPVFFFAWLCCTAIAAPDEAIQLGGRLLLCSWADRAGRQQARQRAHLRNGDGAKITEQLRVGGIGVRLISRALRSVSATSAHCQPIGSNARRYLRELRDSLTGCTGSAPAPHATRRSYANDMAGGLPLNRSLRVKAASPAGVSRSASPRTSAS